MESGKTEPRVPEGSFVMDRPALETLQLLLRFFLDLQRGMEEFRRAFGTETAEGASAAVDPASSDPASSADTAAASPEAWLARLLSMERGPATRADLERRLQEIRLHFAALLEGYQRSVQQGAAHLLDTLDPAEIRREIEGRPVQVGPLRVSSSWRPVLVQGIWEEFLRRHRHYRSLDPADFERLFRAEYRAGYDAFLERHRTPTQGDPAE